ncbi:hypothetical protein BH10BAC3_BH10BAC3_23710 [soil metagenome]
MRTTQISLFTLLVSVVVFTSCQRSIDMNRTTPVQLSAANEAATNKCRLAYGDYFNGFISETYQYNAAGLVSDCQVDLLGSIFIHATMQYDSKGMLRTGTLSYDNITFYDVEFQYENNRIVKEVVYEQGTSIIADYSVNTYNQKGQIIKRASPPFNLYSNFKYDAVGNVINDDVYFIDNDIFVFGIAWQYTKPIKEPKNARPGMPPYSWWWLDELTSPFLPSDRDEFQGDYVGGSFPVFDEDISQTIITPAAQNLPSDRLSFDNISGSEFYNYWEYENCGGKNGLNQPARKQLSKMDQRTKDLALLRMPLLRGSKVKQQLEERKAIYQRLKK